MSDTPTNPETDDDAVCIRCYETDMPIGRTWAMGTMRPMKDAPRPIQRKLGWTKDDMRNAHLCGNCYFDLTDDAR